MSVLCQPTNLIFDRIVITAQFFRCFCRTSNRFRNLLRQRHADEFAVCRHHCATELLNRGDKGNEKGLIEGRRQARLDEIAPDSPTSRDRDDLQSPVGWLVGRSAGQWNRTTSSEWRRQ